MTTPTGEPVGVLIVDKPQGITSHDVVARLRRVLGTRKVGHAGTLDPMATGVLVLACGSGTRLLPYLQATRKEYTATIRLGWSTTTDDRTGEPLSGPAEVVVDQAAVDTVLAGFIGRIEQVPSAVSAVKVDGRRAYALVRAGQAPDLAARAVHIHALERSSQLRSAEQGSADFDIAVTCSSGTYIRALARDLGEALAVGGHLTALRRTRVGGFGLEQARALDELAEAPSLSYDLDAACLASFPRRDIDAGQVLDCAHGRPLAAAGIEGIYAATGPDGHVIALLEDRGDRTKSVVVIRPATL